MNRMNKTVCTIAIDDAPCLRAENIEVEQSWFKTDMIKTLATNMIYTMNRVRGIGIAAPQIGINWKVAVAIIDRKPLVLINPTVVNKADDTISIEEGCLSCPDKNVRILRPAWIEVKYNSINGKENVQRFAQIDSIIVSHELDHLVGKLITDYVDATQ